MATTEAIRNYYADLLILQYLGKPKAYAHMQTLAEPVLMDQLPDQVQNAFDINTAVGVQLDILGKYCGATRTAKTSSGLVTLTDDEFRSLIQLAIVRNMAGSSLAEIQQLLLTYLGGKVVATDGADMQMGYFINSSIGSLQLIQAMVIEGFLPKPMGVQLSSIIYAAFIDSLFGFRTYIAAGVNNSPFNTYTDYHTDRPWLKYSDTIIF